MASEYLDLPAIPSPRIFWPRRPASGGANVFYSWFITRQPQKISHTEHLGSHWRQSADALCISSTSVAESGGCEIGRRWQARRDPLGEYMNYVVYDILYQGFSSSLSSSTDFAPPRFPRYSLAMPVHQTLGIHMDQFWSMWNGLFMVQNPVFHGSARRSMWNHEIARFHGSWSMWNHMVQWFHMVELWKWAFWWFTTPFSWFSHCYVVSSTWCKLFTSVTNGYITMYCTNVIYERTVASSGIIGGMQKSSYSLVDGDWLISKLSRGKMSSYMSRYIRTLQWHFLDDNLNV